MLLSFFISARIFKAENFKVPQRLYARSLFRLWYSPSVYFKKIYIKNMVLYSQTISLNSRCYYKSKQSHIISQKISTNCTSLVPYGTNWGSTLNIGRLSKDLHRLIYLPYNI